MDEIKLQDQIEELIEIYSRNPDAPRIGECIAEWEAEIDHLENGGDHAPWLSREECIKDAKERTEKLKLIYNYALRHQYVYLL